MTLTRPKGHTKANPSMLDVANHAGVSIATVSNVLNYPAKVTAVTAAKVKASIDELGFVRNDAARSLATGTSSTLGMVVADVENSLFVDMASGAQAGAKSNGLNLLLGNAECSLEQQDSYLDVFDEARVAGLLLAPMEDSSAGIERMRSHGRQIVLLNFHPDNQDCCAVVVDNEQVGYLAARHLIAIGRRRLAFVAAKDGYQPVHDRRLGVKRAVEESAGVTLEEIDSTGLTFADGVRVAVELSGRIAALPDGVIAVTDALANGVLHHLVNEQGLLAPEDVAVIGCENNRSATSGPVPLTAVELPGALMGEQATRLLLEELEAAPGEHAHRTVVIQPYLVERTSTIGRAFSAPLGS